MLDLLSDGRVEFGSGESSSEAELGGFHIDPARKRDAWLEGLETALRCMVEVPFTGVDGEFVQMPPRNVVPKPRQKPHPPLWVACSRRETIRLAASKGMGALTFAFIDPEEARTWVQEYETALRTCQPVGWAVNPQVACVSPMMVHHNEDEAIRRGVEGANFFGYSLGHYYVFGTHRPGRTDVWSEYTARRVAQGFDPDAVAHASPTASNMTAKVASGETTGLRGCIGTPKQARDYLQRYEEAGVDQVVFVLQAGRNRHEDIMESLELFGREVLPEFADRDVAATAAKERRLAPIIEDALARRPDDTRALGDYEFPAIPRQWADANGSLEMREWLDRFADDRAAGKHDTAAGILG